MCLRTWKSTWILLYFNFKPVLQWNCLHRSACHQNQLACIHVFHIYLFNCDSNFSLWQALDIDRSIKRFESDVNLYSDALSGSKTRMHACLFTLQALVQTTATVVSRSSQYIYHTVIWNSQRTSTRTDQTYNSKEAHESDKFLAVPPQYFSKCEMRRCFTHKSYLLDWSA